MQLFILSFRIISKYKELFICLLMGFLLMLLRLYLVRFQLKDEYGTWYSLVPLRSTLSLSMYVFIIFLFTSYEYFALFKLQHIKEVIQLTPLGRKYRPQIFQGLILTVIAGVFTVCVIIINLIFYAVLRQKLQWEEIDLKYIVHIIWNSYIYIFLIAFLAIILGIIISSTERRLFAYAILLFIIFLISPFMEEFANALILSQINIFPIKEFFNILPINLNFSDNYMFGFSLLPYRIALLFFWIFLCATIICYKARQRKLLKIVMIILCGINMFYYCLPASKVIMNYSPNGTALADQYYYYMNAKKMVSKNEKANYRIVKYKMKLDIGRLLNAEVIISIDNQMLKEYKMTLYHGYKVNKATDHMGRKLDFKQSGDYLLIKRGDDPLEKIIIQYSGYSAKFYSNYQGICLPGYFPYYPRAGYEQLGENFNNGWFSFFLGENVFFDVYISDNNKVFTNLNKKRENHYAGTCNGPTFVSGFVKGKKIGKNRIVYPYLAAGEYENTGISQQEHIDLFMKSITEKGYKNCTVFIMPELNQMRNGIISSQQIFFTGIYDDIDDLRDELKTRYN